jgi:hypothetical protein
MTPTEDEIFCRNCGELLYRVLRSDDGIITMKNPAVEPERDGIQKFFRCPTCFGKNLVMLVEDPPGSRFYELAGFMRS